MFVSSVVFCFLLYYTVKYNVYAEGEGDNKWITFYTKIQSLEKAGMNSTGILQELLKESESEEKMKHDRELALINSRNRNNGFRISIP